MQKQYDSYGFWPLKHTSLLPQQPFLFVHFLIEYHLLHQWEERHLILFCKSLSLAAFPGKDCNNPTAPESLLINFRFVSRNHNLTKPRAIAEGVFFNKVQPLRAI